MPTETPPRPPTPTPPPIRPPSANQLLRAKRKAARIAEANKPPGRKSQEVDHILRTDPIPWRPTTK